MIHFAEPPQRVCILRLSAIGDVCHALPVINTLRAAWPGTRFTWIVGRLEADLIGDVPGIEFLCFDKSAGIQAYRSLRRQLQGRRFDLLLHMQMALRASLASLSVRAPLRLGFDRTRAHDFQWLFTNRHIPHVPREHVMDSFFGFARAVGVAQRRLEWGIPIPAAAESFAREIIPVGQDALLISPCATGRFHNWRDWPYERYCAVADYVVRELGWRVIITGGSRKSEETAAAAIMAASTVPVINLQGKTNLKKLLALITRARVILSPDSGPIHMATAVRTPVIGLYATTNPDRAGPYLSQQWRVNRYPDAVREFLGKAVEDVPWGTRVRDPRAMALITSDEVVEMLARFASAGE